jgi:hypothetical protein
VELEEMRIITFFKSFGAKEINTLVVTSNKLTNNFAGLVTSGLGPMWPAGCQFHHAVLTNQLPDTETEGPSTLILKYAI